MASQQDKTSSNTKRTLLMLLNQEIDDLQQGVRAMKQEDLIKSVAKRKVIYNISRQGELQLIYALIALADYYINKAMLESAVRSIEQSRDIRVVGDSSYLMGNILMKKGQKKQALAYYEQSLQQEWIEPSEEHKTAAKLEAMTQMQQMYFQQGQKEKLKQLSYDKIRLTRQSGVKYSENYFHALSLADMAVIHQAFGEFPEALEKIEGAITILQSCGEEPSKQIQLLKTQSSILGKMGKMKGEAATLQKALNVLQNYPNCIDQSSQMDLLEKYIQSCIFN